MKKFLLFAAVLLTLAGCKKESEEPVTPAESDKISVSPASREVGGEGGTATTKVTSSGDWTLGTADGKSYGWVTSDRVSGKNGETVTFTVDPNTEAELTAEFVFTCGKAAASFTIVSTPAEVKTPVLEVISENPVEVDYAAGEFTVELSVTDVDDVADLEAAVDGSWVTCNGPAEAGSVAGTARMNFSYSANDSSDPREAEITVSYPNADPVTVTVSQKGKPVETIEITSETEVEVEYTEGTLQVNLEVSSGISVSEVKASVSQTWLKFIGTDFGAPGTAVMNFSYEANPTSVAREAVITVQYDNMDYGSVTVAQKGDPNAGGEEPGGDYLITKAAYMKAHCAGVAEWKTPEAGNLGTTFTVEMLLKHDKEFEYTSSWNGNGIGTMFGLERRFLLRHGDNQSNYQEWELVYVLNAKEDNGDHIESKVKSSMNIPADEWVHIAAVLDGENKTVTIYQNGQSVGSAAMDPDIRPVDLTETYPGYEGEQKFYLGRSYANNRDFCGLMSEVRVWNRALSAAEINAENHFYTVDPNSEGLVAYWKMNEGEGYIIKDHTANGNDLTGEVYSGYSWSNGMEWRDVQLPE